ncbi:MAG: KEOPS complex kinase/ATPase Bud32 [Candidatus Hadarchaeota archaeon]
MALMKKGAEANLYLEPFSRVLHGGGQGQVVLKHRIQKRYRVEEIDHMLRRSRTSLESKLLSDAKRGGVPTPVVYEVDRDGTQIVMEYIDGAQVKKALESAAPAKRRNICRTIGRLVARLHQAGMVHGDLTTSNMILAKDGKIYFVDFGLGEYDRSTEARGVDLHLLRRALQSIHFRITEEAYRAVLSGYRKDFGRGAEEVIKRAEDIMRRGRYVRKEDRA